MHLCESRLRKIAGGFFGIIDKGKIVILGVAIIPLMEYNKAKVPKEVKNNGLYQRHAGCGKMGNF